MFSFQSVVSFFRYFRFFWGVFASFASQHCKAFVAIGSPHCWVLPMTAGNLLLCYGSLLRTSKNYFAVQLAAIRRVALCRSAAVMLCKYWNLTHASNQEVEKKMKRKMFIMKVLRMQRCEWVSAADWKNSDWVEFKIFRETQEWPFMITIIFNIALSFFTISVINNVK